MKDIHFIINIDPQQSVEDILLYHGQAFPPFGNDLDLLVKASLLLMGGHYKDSISFSNNVQSADDIASLVPEMAGKQEAEDAFANALERATPLLDSAINGLPNAVQDPTRQDFLFVLANMRQK